MPAVQEAIAFMYLEDLHESIGIVQKGKCREF